MADKQAAEMAFFIFFVAWSVAMCTRTFVHAFGGHHVPGVKFEGRYILPNKSFDISSVENHTVRRSLLILQAAIRVTGTGALVTGIALVWTRFY